MTTARDVLKVFINHIKPHKGLFAIIIITLTAGETIAVFAPWFYKQFFDVLTGVREVQGETVAEALVGVLLIIILIHTLNWFFQAISSLVNNYFQPRIIVDLEQTSFSYLLDHSFRFFTNTFAGSLVRKVRRLSRSFEALADQLLFKFIPLIVTIAGSLIILSTRSMLIAGVFLIWLIVFITANYLIALWKMKYDERRAKLDSKVTATLADSITNNVNIKLFVGQDHERSLFRTVTEKIRRLHTFTWNLSLINDFTQWGLMIVLEFFIMYFGIQLWQKGLLTIGDFAMFQSYMVMLFGRMYDLGRVIRRGYEAVADAKEMVEILNTPHEVRDTKSAKPLVVTKGAIEFKDVTFRYRKTRKILDSMNLTIKANERVALVGPSGAGKSTIVKLLFRFFNISSGKILIDDQILSRITQNSLREQIALVPQDSILFHRSLLENIRYGRRDATDEEVIEAAKKARCHDFIQDFPKKYDTLVGERGVKLSGGERQRVAIARAILKDAPILVLDEATSSLDSESEQLIQEALEILMKDKTTIVIAHRLSTILKMDRIVVMKKGRVVDSGTHKQLMRKKGLYKTLWEIQAGGFIE